MVKTTSFNCRGRRFCPGASLIAQLVKNLPAVQDSWVRKIRWRRDRLPTPVFLSFPCGSAGKESACNAGDLGSIPGLGRSPGEGKGYPLQYSGLENSMDYIVHAGEFHGLYSPWGLKESDMTKRLSLGNKDAICHVAWKKKKSQIHYRIKWAIEIFIDGMEVGLSEVPSSIISLIFWMKLETR